MAAITPAGRARHAEVAERRAELVVHLLGSFSPADRAVLASMLERFVGSVDDFVAHLDARDSTESA
jgi:hypothetical protein